MKNIVITGSSRGIGLEMAKVFLQRGCCVTISGRSGARLQQLRSSLGEWEAQTLFVPCDVRIRQDVERLWRESAQQWGSVDCWINNAGRNSPYAHVYEICCADADAVIDTNIKGIVYGSQVAVQHMLAQGQGQIWNMEGLGSNGMIQTRAVLYGMTKRALTYFCEGLAKELRGTQVLAGRLSPGMMLTDLITKGPDGEPAPVLQDPRFVRVFNILGDRPETVAQYLVPKILANTKQGARVAWMTNAKAFWRFLSAPFARRRLI